MADKPIAPLYRAGSWSTAPNNKPTKRQPHLFYRAGEVDAVVDALTDKHAFEARKWAALEAFYMKELGYGR